MKPILGKSIFETWQVVGAVIIVLAVFFYSRGCWSALHQDDVWKRKVKRQINLEEVRGWALAVMKQGDPYGPVTVHQTFLTNAPSYLIKNYKHQPYVRVGFDCIELSYGGGMYSWGLTIGQTNLASPARSGKYAEQWAPGIYFWSN